MGNPVIILWLLLKTGGKNLWLILSLMLCAFISNTLEASAQISPDSTLPNNSVVLPDANGNLIEITEGTTAGNNLFHSFQEFSVANGQTAFFNNGLTIENIFSRVTGGSVSNIDGIIRANGAANLFLINPNGIIFGQDASLDIGGSFLGGTANSIQLSDGSFYSAVDPQAPSLLEVNIPIGLQYGSGAGNIIVEGAGNSTGFTAPGANNYALIKDFRPSGLQTDEGKSLALIGGNIALDGGNLTAAEGHIELGSVTEGSVKLDRDGGIWTFDYQGAAEFQDITLANAASIEVSGNSSGTVNVRGQNITLTDASAILANTSGDGTAGSITLNGTESVQVTGVSQNNIPFVSYVSTGTTLGSTGAGADLNINTNYLLVAGGAQVDTPVFGSGDGGTLTVDAERVELISGSPVAGSSGLFAPVVPGATGDGGDINVDTNSLLVAGGAQLFAFSVSSATGGDININAQDIELNGASPNGTASGLFTNTFANGDGGNLTIDTNTLVVKDGADISSTVFGVGAAGNINITAQNIELSDLSDRERTSQISASVTEGATGFGGDINIDTTRLTLSSGTQISSSLFGSGEGGNVNVTADEINLSGYSATANTSSGLFTTIAPGATGKSGNLTINTDNLRAAEGAQIAVSTGGSGSAGNLTVTASDSIELLGNATDAGGGSSGLFSSAVFGDGDGGNIELTTSQLTIQDGATISASNFLSGNADVPPGTGTAGSIEINADSIKLDGIDEDTPASITASTFAGGGGNIQLNVDRSLTVKNNSEITAETQGTGQGGLVDVTADSIELDNGGKLSTNTFGTGDGGAIALNADKLNLNNNGTISSSSTGTGQAGDINITANNIRTDEGEIAATSEQSGGGNINIDSDFLYLDNNSKVSSSVTDSNGGGGNVKIDSGLIVAVNNSDIIAQAVFGPGGRISIFSEALLNSFDSDIDASSAFGVDGEVEINSLETEKEISLIELPETVSDPTDLITATCPIQRDNVMVVSGKGGLPENPRSHLRGQSVWQDLRSIAPGLTATEAESANTNQTQTRASHTQDAIAEAKGWMVNSQGNVELVAQANNESRQDFWYRPVKCREL